MENKKRKKVTIAVPNLDWIHKAVTRAVLRMFADKRYALEYDDASRKPLDNNRNHMVRDFLSGDGDYLLFMDDDNPPVPDANPLDLVELDKDVIVLPTPMWPGEREKTRMGGFPLEFNTADEHGELWTEHIDRRGLQEVHAGGTGCMLIARRVLEKVKPAFIRDVDEYGCVTRGADYLFCRRAREAGFEIWAHFDYLCSHFRERDLLQLWQHMAVRDISTANRPNINTPEYWDNEWAKREPRVLKFYSRIADMAVGKTVLDFGCGRGDLLEMIADRAKHAEGIDIAESAVQICRGRGLNAHVGDSLPNDSWYDMITCTEVLEHIDDDQSVIEDMFNHTDVLVYSVPNNCMPPSIEPEHRRVYTRDYIEKITPHLRIVYDYGVHLLVVAARECNAKEHTE